MTEFIVVNSSIFLNLFLSCQSVISSSFLGFIIFINSSSDASLSDSIFDSLFNFLLNPLPNFSSNSLKNYSSDSSDNLLNDSSMSSFIFILSSS